MDQQTKNLLKAILVGSASYILCFTVGRYIFTPILAWMQKDIHFNDTFAGYFIFCQFCGLPAWYSFYKGLFQTS